MLPSGNDASLAIAVCIGEKLLKYDHALKQGIYKNKDSSIKN